MEEGEQPRLSRLGGGSDPSLALHQGPQAAGHMQCLKEPGEPSPNPGGRCCLRGSSGGPVSGVLIARRWEIWVLGGSIRTED